MAQHFSSVSPTFIALECCWLRFMLVNCSYGKHVWKYVNSMFGNVWNVRNKKSINLRFKHPPELTPEWSRNPIKILWYGGNARENK